MDEEGFLYIMSRSDDVINVAGHRLSTGALEEVKHLGECRLFNYFVEESEHPAGDKCPCSFPPFVFGE